MRLAKKHIGKLFDVKGSDGSWAYQLVDVWRTWLLFYDLSGNYVKEKNGHTDWRYFKPRKPWPIKWRVKGWETAKETE